MNGIDKITGKIAVDAKQEAEAILSQARSEAAAITKSYEAKSQEEAKRILAAGEEQAREIQRRAKSAAELEARQQVLATKQELDDIEAAAAKKMEAAVEFAMNSPEPDPAHVLDDVFYEG